VLYVVKRWARQHSKTQETNDQILHSHPYPQNRGRSHCWHCLRRPNFEVYIWGGGDTNFTANVSPLTARPTAS